MRALPLLGALAALVAAGCGSGSDGTSSPATAAGSPSGAVASAAKADVGRVLVDAQGMTLYRFTAERDGRIACTGDCTTTWPPAPAPSDGELGAGVGTVERADGTRQLTYGGAPLYRYAGDHSPADARGDGVNGTWFAVTPSEAGGGGSSTRTMPQRYGY